jgi:hypothetical protein
VDDPVVGVDDLRPLAAQHPAEVEDGLGIGDGRSVTTSGVAFAADDPVAAAPQGVDLRPGDRAGRDVSGLLQGRDRNLVPAGHQLAGQVLNHALFAADNGGE